MKPSTMAYAWFTLLLTIGTAWASETKPSTGPTRYRAEVQGTYVNQTMVGNHSTSINPKSGLLKLDGQSARISFRASRSKPDDSPYPSGSRGAAFYDRAFTVSTTLPLVNRTADMAVYEL